MVLQNRYKSCFSITSERVVCERFAKIIDNQVQNYFYFPFKLTQTNVWDRQCLLLVRLKTSLPEFLKDFSICCYQFSGVAFLSGN